jgi:hypothetical protein
MINLSQLWKLQLRSLRTFVFCNQKKKLIQFHIFDLGHNDDPVDHNDRSKFKVNLKFIVKSWNYLQKNRKSQLSDVNIRNYGSIMYRKVAREQLVDQFTLFSVHNWPIIANIVIWKSTIPIFLKVFSILYNELEIDLKLWPVIVPSSKNLKLC